MKKLVIRTLSLMLAVMFTVLCFASCGKSENAGEQPSTTAAAQSLEHSKVLFTMENGKTFTIELYPEYAPETVTNFLKLVNEGFYNGLTFHRVCDNFMAQGGDPEGTGSGGSPETIHGEFYQNGFTQNTLSHKRGVVSMARLSNDMNSASSQFFICYTDCSFLDGGYAAFGEVVEGMETVDDFLNVKRVMGSDGAISKPVEPIVIKTAEQIG